MKEILLDAIKFIRGVSLDPSTPLRIRELCRTKEMILLQALADFEQQQEEKHVVAKKTAKKIDVVEDSQDKESEQ